LLSGLGNGGWHLADRLTSPSSSSSSPSLCPAPLTCGQAEGPRWGVAWLRKIASARSASCRAMLSKRSAASLTCCRRSSGDSARRKAWRAKSCHDLRFYRLVLYVCGCWCPLPALSSLYMCMGIGGQSLPNYPLHSPVLPMAHAANLLSTRGVTPSVFILG